MRIDDFLTVKEQSTPSSPSSGSRLLYPKSSGWYDKDSSGVERLLTHAIEPVAFYDSRPTLTALTGTLQYPLDGDYTFQSIVARLATVPTGATTFKLDVNKNGTTIWTTQANRPIWTASANLATWTAPDVTTFTSGDYLTFDIDAIGSTIPGGLLVVVLRLRRMS